MLSVIWGWMQGEYIVLSFIAFVLGLVGFYLFRGFDKGDSREWLYQSSVLLGTLGFIPVFIWLVDTIIISLGY